MASILSRPQCVNGLYPSVFPPGVGGGLCFVPAMSAPIRHFPVRHAATIAGGITTAETLGPLIYTLVYNNFFIGDGSLLNQDFRGYMLFVALSIGASHLLGLIVFDLPQCYTTDPESLPLTTKSNNNKSTSDVRGKEKLMSKGACKLTKPDLTCQRSAWQMVRSLPFQLMIWSAILIHSMKFFSVYNVNVFLVSLEMEKYDKILPYISPASSTLLKTLFGFLVDALKGRFSLTWYMTLASIIHTFFFLIGLFYLSNIYMLSWGIVLWTFASDIALVVEPVMNIQYFGKDVVSINWGFFLGLWAMVTFGSQLLFAEAYYLFAEPETGQCFGRHCFMAQQITYTAISCTCLVLSLALYVIDKKRGNR